MKRANGVRVVFKPVYELIASLAVFVDKSLSKNSELGEKWAKTVRKQLPPFLSKQLTGKTLQKDLSLLGYLLILSHEQPVHTTEEIAGWFNEMNVQKLFEFNSSPAFMEEFIPTLKNMPQTIKLLEEWEQAYFKGVDPAVIKELKEEAVRTQQLVGEMDPIDLVEQATYGIRLEGIHPGTTIFLSPQYHARPFNFFANYEDLFIAQFPSDILQVSGEPPPGLIRLTTALADPTRLKILRLLADGERSFTDIVKNFSTSKSTIHYHLISLRASGLVRVHVKAKEAMRYSLRRTTIGELGTTLNRFLEQSAIAMPETGNSKTVQ